MIIWQLMNVLSNRKELLEELKLTLYKQDLEEEIVLKFLSRSDEIFSVCLDGNLRSNKSNYSFKLDVSEELSAVEAYQKYGGKALSDVIDYGSWKIPSNLT